MKINVFLPKIWKTRVGVSIPFFLVPSTESAALLGKTELELGQLCLEGRFFLNRRSLKYVELRFKSQMV